MNWSTAFAIGVLRGMGWALLVGALWWCSWKVGLALERKAAERWLRRTTHLPPPSSNVVTLAGRVRRDSLDALNTRNGGAR